MHTLIAISQRPLEDFLSDPVLTVACVLLIIVGLMWIITARVIAHNQKRALKARRRRRNTNEKTDEQARPRSAGAPTQAMRRTRD
jgi:hypothetical protein